MKIDFTKPILGRKGTPLIGETVPAKLDEEGTVIEPEKKIPLALSDVAIVAIDQADDKIEAKEKYRRGRLADKIYGAKEPIDLPSEDITLLKELVGKKFGPLIVNHVWDMLDPQGE